MTAIRTRYIVRAMITAAVALTLVGVPAVASAAPPTTVSILTPTCTPLTPVAQWRPYVSACAVTKNTAFPYVVVKNISDSTVLNVESSLFFSAPQFLIDAKDTYLSQLIRSDAWDRIKASWVPFPPIKRGMSTRLLPPRATIQVGASGADLRTAARLSAAYMGALAVGRAESAAISGILEPPTLRTAGAACASAVANAMSVDPSRTSSTAWRTAAVNSIKTVPTCRSFFTKLNAETSKATTLDEYASSVGKSVLKKTRGGFLGDLFDFGLRAVSAFHPVL